MEDLVYRIESDPAKAITANQKLAQSFEQVTTSTDKLGQVFAHFDQITGNTSKSFSEIEHVTVSARDKFDAFANSTGRVGLSMLRTTDTFTAFNKSAGGIP